VAAPTISLRSLAPNNKIPLGARPLPPGRLPGLGEAVAQVRHSTSLTQQQTIFTTVGQSKLYVASQDWVRITLTLQTAGPVAIGTSADLLPVLSGKGLILATDIPVRFLLPRGNIVYIAANAVNRVSFQIEPQPFYEGLLQAVGNVGVAVSGVGAAAGQALGQVLRGLFSK